MCGVRALWVSLPRCAEATTNAVLWAAAPLSRCLLGGEFCWRKVLDRAHFKEILLRVRRSAILEGQCRARRARRRVSAPRPARRSWRSTEERRAAAVFGEHLCRECLRAWRLLGCGAPAARASVRSGERPSEPVLGRGCAEGCAEGGAGVSLRGLLQVGVVEGGALGAGPGQVEPRRRRAERAELAARPSLRAALQRPWWRCTSTKARSRLSCVHPPPASVPRAPGEQIITQGDTGATFFIMFSGTVDVYKERFEPCEASCKTISLQVLVPTEPSVIRFNCTKDDMRITTLEAFRIRAA